MANDFESFSESKHSKKSGRRHRNEINDNDERGDFISIFSDLFNKINYKVAILLFVLGVLIFSDSFSELFLTGIDGATDSTDCATSKGTIIQLLALTFGYIIIDLLAKGDII